METAANAGVGGAAVAPPRLAPVSGVLSQGQGVIKPIACRPVVSSANTTPILGNRCLNSSSQSVGQQQQQQAMTSSPAGGAGLSNNTTTTNNNNINNNNGGRHSWGLYNSTSDLRCSALSTGPAQQQTPTSRGQPHLQRFSWSKGPHVELSEMGTLCARPAAAAAQQTAAPPSVQQQRKLDTSVNGRASDLSPSIQHQNKATAGSITSINSISSTAAGQQTQAGRVADLSRRFGGSLSSVAAPPNSPTQIRQPPAYRPPPCSSRSSVNKGSSGVSGVASNNSGGVTYSSSELHLDRVSSLQPFNCARPGVPNGTSTPQWVLGGSEMNLSSLARSTLPRHSHQQQQDVENGGLLGLSKNNKGGLLLSAYDPLHHHSSAGIHHHGSMMSCNGSRSSWAGLPSVSNNNNNNNSSSGKGSSLTNSTMSSNGSSTTLLSTSFERRGETDGAVTPVVEQGRIRSILGSNCVISSYGLQRMRKQSTGSSLDEDFDCCDGGDNSQADETPSPSDSGVAELEVLLKEKDCEIALLRETLEQNEAVIFQVYQEKEKSWERELKKLRSVYEERMRAAQQQSSQAERQLQTQTQQWQSDRKQLKQQVQQLKSQLEQVQSRLDETSWTLCQKSGEMALLKSQLKESQNEQSQRCQEMAKMRAQLKESQELAHNTRQRLEQAMTHQKPLDNRRSITSPILSSRKLIGESEPNSTSSTLSMAEVQRLQRRIIEQQQSIEAERQVWHEEKATVLVYQRHLQQQYVQAMKRNQQLEDALGLLGITGVPSSMGQQHKHPPMSSPKSNCSDPITIDLDSSSNSSSTGETHC